MVHIDKQHARVRSRTAIGPLVLEIPRYYIVKMFTLHFAGNVWMATIETLRSTLTVKLCEPSKSGLSNVEQPSMLGGSGLQKLKVPEQAESEILLSEIKSCCHRV